MHTTTHASVRRGPRSLNRKVIGLGMLLIIAVCATLAGQPAAVGSAGLARMVKDIKTTDSSNPWEMTAHGSAVFFTANDGVHGRELWKTDGTPGGTVMVADINAGPASAFEYYSGMLTSFKGHVIFSANDGVHGVELWKTDGTLAGTSLLKDIVPGAGTSRAHSLAVVGDTLFFVAEESVHGSELWKTDGTAAGTVLLKDLTPDDTGYDHEPENLINVNGTLYFMYDGGVNYGVQLWKSDGSAAGTVLVKSFTTTGPNAFVTQFTTMGGFNYFTASGIEGGNLWKTDGTPAGTQPVQLFDSDSTGVGSLILFKDELYFFADTLDAKGALWKSDGTKAGTVMVKNIATDGTHSNAGGTIILNDRLVFIADLYPFGREVWVSDGTTAGTTLLKNINPTSENTWFTINAVSGLLYFGPSDGVHGRELWSSDGTAGGTKLLQDIAPGAAGSDPDNFIGLNGLVLFTADNGVHGRELWSASLRSFEVHLPLIQR